jgi:5,6,7,8-tetrahydromethanopterin hydro-lyase
LEESQFGEAFVGDGVNAAHVNTILGRRGGPVETAWATAIATPTQGHAPFVTVLRPGLAVQPFTLFVNKAMIASEAHATMTWGAAQAGVAGGVADAVASGVIEMASAIELLLIAAVWVNPDADDPDEVYRNNRAATAEALAAGRRGDPAPEAVVAERDGPWNPFFTPSPAVPPD